MPRLNGVEVLLAAKRLDPDLPVIMITGYPSAETVRLVNLGAADYITKPFNVDLMKLTVAKALAMRKAVGPRWGTPTDRVGPIEGFPEVHDFDLFSKLLKNEVEWSELRDRVCSLLMAEIVNFNAFSIADGAPAGDEAIEIFALTLTGKIGPGDHRGAAQPGRVRCEIARDRSQRGQGYRGVHPHEGGPWRNG